MRILAIESSCDETSASLVENGTHVLSNVIATSRHAFEKSGGVIPEQAARKQVEAILPTIEQALAGTGIEPKDLDALAVTKGPGLLGSLLVGTSTMRVLSKLWNKPLIGVHHTLGHLSSTWLGAEEEFQFPILTLSASGGHTELWLRTSHMHGTLLGRTRDDAAGEAFDKGASLLGLPYPGGPAIGETAKTGNPHAIPFPLPLKKEPTLDFSFSGLKTSLRYVLRDQPVTSNDQLPNIAASYQHALCHHLCDRIALALEQHPEIKEVHLVGGVSANLYLREQATKICGSTALRWPQKISYCTDNAAMIAAAATFLLQEYPDEAKAEFVTAASLPLAAAIR